MTNAVIIDAIRTPIGKGKASGSLASVHPVDLFALTLRQLAQRTGLEPGAVNDVIVGCVNQVGEQSGTPGRQAVLAAGWPEHVPAVTVERKCGSGQQAIDFANQGIVAGMYDVVVAGGVESMSQVPIGSNRGSKDPFGAAVLRRYPLLVNQGMAAEIVADRWNLTRTDLDEFSARSHLLATEARRAGYFTNEIVPVTVEGPTAAAVTTDETIRPGSTVATLGQLVPAFASDQHRAMFPHIDFKITAGNSSQITDGASALLITSESYASKHELRPRARIVASVVCGSDPQLMLTGPIEATNKVLFRAGLTLDDIDAFEVNEAFACVPLVWQKELGVPLERLNPSGGAIALGHPLGATGARMLTTLINYLERTGGRYGLQTICEAGGMANAMIVEVLA